MTTTDTQQTITERMWDATARVERIIHFEAMLIDPSRDLCEWLMDDMGALIKEALSWNEEEWGPLEDLTKDPDEFVDAVRRLRGWAVQISTPAARGMDEGYVMFSWGDYYSKCFMGETYDAALDAGITWAEGLWQTARDEADRNKPKT